VQRTFQLQTPQHDALAEFRFIGIGGIIAQIIALPHERVDRAHGIPLRLLKQQEGIIEILRPLARDLTAVAV